MTRPSRPLALAALACALLLAPSSLGAASAQQTTSGFSSGLASNPGEADDGWLWGDTAILRGLDKVTAATRDFEAPVGEDVRFFALTINVKKCAKRPPEETPETIVGMEIFDRQTDGSGNESEPELIFSNWMFGSSPALNPLEHPVYDVWALDCVGGETDRSDDAAQTADGDDAATDDGAPPADVGETDD